MSQPSLNAPAAAIGMAFEPAASAGDPPRPATARASGHAWRGVLIALIVLGHNHLFATGFLGAYRVIYNFHVEAFLIIPFLRPTDRMRRTQLLYPVRNYYRPFCVFMTGYAVLFALSGLAEAPASFGEALARWACAVVVANSDVLNWATGFKMFWFLPVFILLATARALLDRAGPRALACAIAGAAALHLTVGGLGAGAVAWLPWGLPVIGYMLLPCLIAAALARSGFDRAVPVWAIGLAFAATVSLCAAGKFWINLSDFKIYGAHSLGGLLATDACMVAASLFFARVDGLVRVAPFEALGRYSLQIYLIHGVIGYALVRLAEKHHGGVGTLPLVAITYAVTLALAYVAARLLMASRVGGWIFNVTPRGG